MSEAGEEFSMDLGSDEPSEAQTTERTLVDNSVVTRKYTTPMTADEIAKYDDEVAYLPTAVQEDLETILTKETGAGYDSTPKGREWGAVLQSSVDYNHQKAALVDTVANPAADWRQEVQSDVGPLAPGFPSFKVKDGQKPSGERARQLVRQGLRLGGTFNIPLWHSGFWVRVEAPSDAELINANREIANDKKILGRATKGLIFSNHGSYTNRAVLDLFVSHIRETSIDLPKDANILDYINMHDLETVYWGLASAIWSRGFMYMRSCVSSPDKCNHVIKERLDLSKLQRVNFNGLTKSQIAHMTKRATRSMTPESVRRYQEEMLTGSDRLVELSPDVSVVLRTPNLSNHLQAGYEWVSGIEEAYGRALEADEDVREDFLLKQGRATAMRQYSHYVKEIKYGEMSFDDEETINGMLDDMSADDILRKAFLDKVQTFIDSSVISLIALDTFKCPACGGEQRRIDVEGKFPSLIPIDVIRLFFTLLPQKTQKAGRR